MLPNNDKYKISTALVETDDKKKFMEEVVKVQNNMLNKGYEVTMQFQTVTQGVTTWKTTYFMYIEGKKLNEKVKTV